MCLCVSSVLCLLFWGGLSGSTRDHIRLVEYDVSHRRKPVYKAEYVVTLPRSGSKVWAQSEMHVAAPNQFILPRDASAGHLQTVATSVYRHIDIFDISKATNIKEDKYDCETCSIAPKGVLDPSITPATLYPFIDFNINAQLNRFKMDTGEVIHNGPTDDMGNLVSSRPIPFPFLSSLLI